MDGIPVANVDTTGATSTIAYVTADQLGTPRAIANSSGTTEWQNPYQGNPWNEVAATNTGYTYNLGFPGQYYDEETGLNYNGHRDYDSATGRYIESDPLGLLAGPNTYAYARNNPLFWTDPTGLDVTITVVRQGYSSTGNSLQGTITVTSDQTTDSYSGYTMENAYAGDNHDKPPIPDGSYSAYIRTNHTPNRLGLENVPGYSDVEIHNGSYPKNFKGCIGAGNTHATDFLGHSVDALNQIMNVVNEDGTGNITVNVESATPTFVPFDASLAGPPQ